MEALRLAKKQMTYCAIHIGPCRMRLLHHFISFTPIDGDFCVQIFCAAFWSKLVRMVIVHFWGELYSLWSRV